MANKAAQLLSHKKLIVQVPEDIKRETRITNGCADLYSQLHRATNYYKGP